MGMWHTLLYGHPPLPWPIAGVFEELLYCRVSR